MNVAESPDRGKMMRKWKAGSESGLRVKSHQKKNPKNPGSTKLKGDAMN